MIYNTLAHYYDALVKDEEASREWVSWIESELAPCDCLELACGSGEITEMLAKKGYTMTALDLSEEMVKQAKSKNLEGSYRRNLKYSIHNTSAFAHAVFYTHGIHTIRKIIQNCVVHKNTSLVTSIVASLVVICYITILLFQHTSVIYSSSASSFSFLLQTHH